MTKHSRALSPTKTDKGSQPYLHSLPPNPISSAKQIRNDTTLQLPGRREKSHNSTVTLNSTECAAYHKPTLLRTLLDISVRALKGSNMISEKNMLIQLKYTI